MQNIISKNIKVGILMIRTTRLILICSLLSLFLFGCHNDESAKTSDTQIIVNNTDYEQSFKTDEYLPDNKKEDNSDDIKTDSVQEYELIPPFAFVLNSLYDGLQLDPSQEEVNCIHFSTGITEALMSCQTLEERMKTISYCIIDVNEDGVDELLILDANYPQPGNVSILDMYTVVEGTPVKVMEGWARNSYYLLDNGMFYYSGSGGAAYSIEELLSLEANSYVLTSKGLYFTYPKNDDDMDDCAYYYSADGIYDTSIATEISSDEFQVFSTECESKIVSFEAKTFDLFKKQTED